MSVSKIKNLILLILVLAIVGLLPTVVPTQTARSSEEKQVHEKLSALYASYGIALDAASLPASQTLYSIELTQPDARAAAQALLGSGLHAQETSARTLADYFSDAGSFTLSRSGEVSVRLRESKSARDLTRATRRYLRAMEFDCAALDEPVRESAGVYQLRAEQSLLGVPVFESALIFTYRNSALSSVEGTLYPAGEIVRVSEEACISCADALVALLSSRDSLGWVGSQIISCTQGYVHSETASSALRFVPVWKIETDAGAFHVSGITREVRQLTSQLVED